MSPFFYILLALFLISIIIAFYFRSSSVTPAYELTWFQNLSSQNDQFRAILHQMQEGLIVTDGQFRIQQTNLAFNKIFALQEESEGKTILEALRKHEIDELFHLSAETGLAQEREILLHHPQEKNIFVRVAPLQTNPSSPGFLATFIDVSRIHRLENARREFVANVSHELRTPLTSILGFTETLRSGALETPEIALRFLGKIESNAKLLKKLIEDLLRISQLESGRFELRQEEIQLEKLFQEIKQEYEERFQKAGLDFEVELTAPLRVDAENSALRQVIGNLLDNAIKYCPPPGKVTLRALTDSNSRVRIEVEDQGPGIPSEDLRHLFERFYRVDKARSREMGGTGLGLSISKHLMQMMQGEIGVESELGKGSQFFLTLPKV